MAKPRQKKGDGGKAPGTARKMVILPAVMARRLAALAAWQGRSESSIVAEALRPILADVAVTGGAVRPQTVELSPPLKVAETDAA